MGVRNFVDISRSHNRAKRRGLFILIVGTTALAAKVDERKREKGRGCHFRLLRDITIAKGRERRGLVGLSLHGIYGLSP